MPKPTERREEPQDPTPQAAPVHTIGPIEIERASLPDLSKIKSRMGEKRTYWCGAMPGGPFQNYAFGGREFVLYEEDVQTEEGVTHRFKRAGKVHQLTDAQRDAIVADVRNKVMRGRGPGSKIHPVTHADYKPHESDHASGEYVYMIAVSEEFQTPPIQRSKEKPFHILVPKGAVPLVRRVAQPQPEAVPA